MMMKTGPPTHRRLPPRPRRSTERDSRGTPPELYAALHLEFEFTLDPCPLDTTSTAGCRSWRGQRVFCNPPYSDVGPWLEKAREADLAVYLLPVKSDLPWWHRHVMRANEVRFIRGRLRFAGSSGGAPFPSAIVVFAPLPGITAFSSYDRPPRP